MQAASHDVGGRPDGANRSAVRLAMYVSIAIILMVADHRGQYLHELRSRVATLVYPLVQVVHLPQQAADWLDNAWSGHSELLARNEQLEREQLLLDAKLARLEALAAENARLRYLMQSSKRFEDRALIAELLRVDLDPFRHRVMLNKGRSAGVYVGQPVIDSQGILGQIEQVAEFHSYALLISDASHALPVFDNRSGVRTIAYGTGDFSRLSLTDVSPSADISQGDLLVSSGLGGRFPPGYPVGNVTRIIREPGAAFMTVDVTPLAELDRFREVLLVWPATQNAAPPADESAEPTTAETGE